MTVMQTPSFNHLLYKRLSIVEDYGGGIFAIPDEVEAMAPEEPGRRVWPRRLHIHEDPPIVPMEDGLPMDPYNIELRAYQDDISRSLSLNHMTHEYIMSHMNIPRNDSFPNYPYIRNRDERWRARQGGAGGSGTKGGDDEDEE